MKKGCQGIKNFKVPKTCSFNILIREVSCGANHAAILTQSGHLYMMGDNTFGQLGIGEQCLEGFKNVGQKCAPAPCLVDSLRDMKIGKVCCGQDFTFALIEGQDLNLLYSWGNNQQCQLGLESLNQAEPLPCRVTSFENQGMNITSVSGGLEHTLFVSDSGQAFGCGFNGQGQLAIPMGFN